MQRMWLTQYNTVELWLNWLRSFFFPFFLSNSITARLLSINAVFRPGNCPSCSLLLNLKCLCFKLMFNVAVLGLCLTTIRHVTQFLHLLMRYRSHSETFCTSSCHQMQAPSMIGGRPGRSCRGPKNAVAPGWYRARRGSNKPIDFLLSFDVHLQCVWKKAGPTFAYGRGRIKYFG